MVEKNWSKTIVKTEDEKELLVTKKDKYQNTKWSKNGTWNLLYIEQVTFRFLQCNGQSTRIFDNPKKIKTGTLKKELKDLIGKL